METIITCLEFYFITSLRYLFFTGLFFLIFYKIFKIQFSTSKIQEKKAAKKDFYREILQSLQSNFIITLFGILALFTPLKSHSLIYTSLTDYPIWWIPISLILSLILHDAYFYWMHRLLHHKKIFRYTHLVHHQSTNPSPFTSYSFHYLEAITEGFILFLIIFLIPIHPIALILFTLLGFIINVYGHLGYEIMPQSFRTSLWFEFINTSVYHNIHHRKFKGNYGLYFRFWDRLMKTENPEYFTEYDKIQKNRFHK